MKITFFIPSQTFISIMKYILSFFFLTNFVIIHAQREVPSEYDSLEIRKFYVLDKLWTISSGDSLLYQVNELMVDKATYDYYSKNMHESMGLCRPCLLQYYDYDETLLKEVVSYTSCAVGDFKEFYSNGAIKTLGQYKENRTSNWDSIYTRGYCDVKVGNWYFFSETGDTTYVETWNDGQFVSQIPEQELSEIWKVDVLKKKKVISSKSIDRKDLSKLKLKPHFKNKNQNLTLEVQITITNGGWEKYQSKCTINEFNSINLKEIVKTLEFDNLKETEIEIRITFPDDYGGDWIYHHFNLNL